MKRRYGTVTIRRKSGVFYLSELAWLARLVQTEGEFHHKSGLSSQIGLSLDNMHAV